MQVRRILATGLAAVAILPAYLRAMTVSGPSDAPTLILGDQVLVNMAAYRVSIPYTGWTMWRRTGPARGDMVMFHVPSRGVRGLKRVIGLPGDTVELRENMVYLNGQAIGQEPLERARFAPWISGEHKLGQRVLREGRHWIAYSPGQSDLRTMPALTVPPGHYYVLGDQRDNSNDSRLFGMLDERHIQGRVEMHLRSARPREMMPAW